MKINNLNVLEKVQGFVRPPEENLLGLSLSYQDVFALNSLTRRWNLYGKNDAYAETIRKAIDERHVLKEVTLSKTGRHINQGTVWLEKDVRKALLKEANKLGLEPADYIRGIVYSLNQKLAQEEIEEREYREQLRHENRKIPVQLILDKKLRKKLYKRFDKELKDKKLRDKVITTVTSKRNYSRRSNAARSAKQSITRVFKQMIYSIEPPLCLCPLITFGNNGDKGRFSDHAEILKSFL